MTEPREHGSDTPAPPSGASSPPAGERKGVLAWFARNSVAANIIMAVLLFGGLLMVLGGRIKQEVFPEIDLDMVIVSVPYPGASPEEVEQGVLLAVEEAVRGLDGVKEVSSTATEGAGGVRVELLVGTDPDRALSDVKSAVDRITSFPENAERPVISLATSRQEVISLVIYGNQDEHTLRDLAEQARNDLLQDDRITQVELAGVRPLEISVEIPGAELREHDLTLEAVARAVQQASIDLPAGDVRTAGGDVLLRTKEKRHRGPEFEEVVLVSRPDGSEVRLGDIAKVEDGFRETDRMAYFNGQRAVMLNVFRVGDETPIEVSAAVHEYVASAAERLPPTVHLATWADRAEMYRQRVELLVRNAIIGLVLVLLTLGLFLEMRLAFWVTLGIPISFLGGLLFMPATDVSLNMISLFAFILTLGMVVDDAIVAGEAIYHHRQRGMHPLGAAIRGVKDVAVPITFSILTTCVAFSPMLFVPGMMGKFFRVIPIVVILVLLVSLAEALIILPSHLAHSRPPKGRGPGVWLHRQQQRFSRALERFIEHVYAPFLRKALDWRYLTFAACFALLVACLGLVAGGRLQFTFMPKIDGDLITAKLEMPVGTPTDVTREVQQDLAGTARTLIQEYGGEERLSRGVFSDLGVAQGLDTGPMDEGGASGGHLATVMVYLAPADQRGFTGAEFAQAWRERVGEVPGAEVLSFDYSIGASNGKPIDVELSHSDEEVLESAAGRLAAALEQFGGVKDVDDGYRAGKEQLDFSLRPEGRAAGLTEGGLARQVRNHFFGAEAVRQQRGRNEIRVYVRLPDEERRTLHTVEEMVLRTPRGGEIPLAQAADVERGRAYTSISRTDGRRTVNVTADVLEEEANANQVMASLEADVLPQLREEFPGLTYRRGGQQQEQADAMASLEIGFYFALAVMFGMLAVAFRSYIQPVIVMMAIPFGMVGAVMGHVIMGYDLSLMSMMGVVALAGVVVNSSLILIVAINEHRAEAVKKEQYGGTGPYRSGRIGDPSSWATMIQAVVSGSERRFRPILLTSLTTFLGLSPMIVETSVQAQFLIPMAVSLGFGVLFAMVITLLLVPACYVIVEDFRKAGRATKRTVIDPLQGEATPTPGE